MKCKECQAEFQSTDSRKIYCSGRCGKKFATRKSYFKNHERNKEKQRARRHLYYTPVDVAGTRVKIKSPKEVRNKKSRERYASDEVFRMKSIARATARNHQIIGKITKKDCERCGNPNSEKHHPDYATPGLVKWLCRECHKREHGGSFNSTHSALAIPNLFQINP